MKHGHNDCGCGSLILRVDQCAYRDRYTRNYSPEVAWNIYPNILCIKSRWLDIFWIQVLPDCELLN